LHLGNHEIFHNRQNSHPRWQTEYKQLLHVLAQDGLEQVPRGLLRNHKILHNRQNSHPRWQTEYEQLLHVLAQDGQEQVPRGIRDHEALVGFGTSSHCKLQKCSMIVWRAPNSSPSKCRYVVQRIVRREGHCISMVKV